MKTHCTQNSLLFPSLNRRKTVAHFDGGAITSDARAIEEYYVRIFLQSYRTPPEQIVSRIRQAWPKVHIIIRADSDFCREGIMARPSF